MTRVMHGMMTRFAALAVAALLAGCASESYVVLLDNPDGSTGQVTVSGREGGTATLTKTGQGADLTPTAGEPYLVDDDRIEQDFGTALAATPELPTRFLLYFETGTTTLQPPSEAQFPEVLAAIRARPAVDIGIIGHSDTQGDAELNARLALERAEVIAERIRAANLDVVEITVTSHGERNLLVPTPDDTAEPRNRRVEVSIR
ncbi:OmpA family protein [Roseospirillum parvum]|uniref:Outer membrane protein, adhesin transport system n=1 Tax=Roseospirillum parvum TaxID=83401 RepID=A0A1G7ZF03_9PROT|nr:OmpA family protein [Roseospirillum parvum]SDH07219.1 outer membrane protein, adhesin transport system [Roseospirillum parvum]